MTKEGNFCKSKSNIFAHFYQNDRNKLFTQLLQPSSYNNQFFFIFVKNNSLEKNCLEERDKKIAIIFCLFVNTETIKHFGLLFYVQKSMKGQLHATLEKENKKVCYE